MDRAEGWIEPEVRAHMLARILPASPPIGSIDSIAGYDVHRAVQRAQVVAAGVRDCKEAERLVLSLSLRLRRAASAPLPRQVTLYHNLATMADRLATLLIETRLDDFRANEVVSGVLWSEVLNWELVRDALDNVALAGAAAAERRLVELVGHETYRIDLDERRRRGSSCALALRHLWEGRAAASPPVFCTVCHEMIGTNLDEAIASSGAETGALGPWTTCPRCGSVTLLRA